MICKVLLVVLFIQVSTVNGAHGNRHRRNADTAWMYPCKEQFNEDRTTAYTESERCTAWKKYISCILNEMENSPGYFDWDELSQIQQYKKSMNDSCELSDTCLCEYNFMTKFQNEMTLNFGNSYELRVFLAYTSCLQTSVMPGCDGFTYPSTLLTQAESLRHKYIKTKENCDENMGSNYSPSCWQLKNYIDCIEPLSTAGLEMPLQYYEADDLLQKLNRTDYCEISMSDSCLCELDYVTSSRQHDSCTTVTEYANCLERSYMTGCNYVSLEVLKQSASLSMRQFCPHNSAFDCSAVDLCYIDMSALSTETPESTQQSCMSMEMYINCLQTSVSTDCASAASAVSMIQKLYDGKYNCAGDNVIQDICGNGPCGSIGDYGFGGSSYPDYLPVDQPYPYHPVHPVDYSNNELLAAFFHDVKMEAKETIHEAEETLDAIHDTEEVARG